MSLSIQRPVIKSFKFNRKNIRSVHVKGDECLVSRDVYKAIRYEEKSGKKAIQNLVPNECKLRFGDAVIDLKEEDICLGHNTEHGLKLFLIRCRKAVF